jgi:hypothetical protein
MKKTIDLNDFRNAFIDYGRANHFSYQGLKILFEQLEQLEQEQDQESELDVIGLCCDFNETTLTEWQHDYGNDKTEKMTDTEKLDYIMDRTWLLCHFENDKGEIVIIYQAY